MPNVTSPTHWFAGANAEAEGVQATSLMFALLVFDGQLPAGMGPFIVHVPPPCRFWLQKSSFEYGEERQNPSVQSASDRQGEQNVPSPAHTPARGTQTESGTQV